MAENVVKTRDEKNKKGGFFRQLKGEFKKIIWTDKKTLTKQTIAVIVISAILCAMITLVDTGALALVNLIIR